MMTSSFHLRAEVWITASGTELQTEHNCLLADVVEDAFHKLPKLISFTSHTKQKELNITV